uniref:Uncharacterized protein LOC114348959 n=1 Tax=Diabrotica virgifera virgifera TaxID=50390 RepID=A0A6P7H984_DIAVI
MKTEEEVKKEDSDDDVFSDTVSTNHENEDLVHHNSIGHLNSATAEKYLNIVKPLFKPKKAKKQSPKIKSTTLKKLSFEGQEKATRSPPKTRSTTSKKSPLEVVKATRSSSSATSSTSKGSGFIDASHLIYNDNSIEYVYWDDPNELCDRLELLIASQEAGNISHSN